MKFSKELKIGAFVLVVLVCSFFLINFLRGKDIFNREMLLHAEYDTVEGLVPSAPVFIKGYKAGAVADVEYVPEKNAFIVTCSVKKQFLVPEDSRIIIYSVDIMGGKGVMIEQGSSGILAEDGSFLQGGLQPDLISSLSGSIVPLLAKVSDAVDSLNVTVSGINEILGPENRANIARTLSRLNSLMANAEELSESMNGKSGELTAFIDNLKAISSKLDSVAEKADGAMGDVAGIASQLNESDIKGLISSLDALLVKIQDPDGSLGRLMSDDSVYESVDTLLEDVDDLIQKIKEKPKKYLKISVF